MMNISGKPNGGRFRLNCWGRLSAIGPQNFKYFANFFTFPGLPFSPKPRRIKHYLNSAGIAQW